MSNSNLVDYVRISPNSTNPRNHKIDTITIHHMAGVASVESCGATFADPARQASSNYGIGSDARVGLYVQEKDRSWCSSSRENDHRAITIECSNSSKGGDWPVSDKVYAKLIDLCVDICQRNGIEKLVYTGDTAGNLTLHNMFANTLCPGPYLESRMEDIAARVNARLSGKEEPKEEVKEEPKEEVKEETPSVDLPELASGSKGKTVKAIQLLLIGNQCSCGSCGADGDFGPATKAAVVKYQGKNGLKADGIVGPKTWAKLLGLG